MKVILTVLLLSVVSVFANSPLQLRIINSHNARKGEFPYQISIQFQANQNPFAPYEHHCGGSIISTNWILTAAHCVFFNSSIEYKIVAGINRLSDMHGQESKILQTVIHPEYNKVNQHNDIALLQLVRPFILNDFVQTIALPKVGTIASGYAVATGWGSISTSTEIIIPDFLQTAVLPLLPMNQCNSIFDYIVHIKRVRNPLNVYTNICTGPLSGGVGPCKGDSGGPLARDGVLIGIVSWTLEPCAGQNIPTVYTNVASFIPFIRENVKDL